MNRQKRKYSVPILIMVIFLGITIAAPHPIDPKYRMQNISMPTLLPDTLPEVLPSQRIVRQMSDSDRWSGLPMPDGQLARRPLPALDSTVVADSLVGDSVMLYNPLEDSLVMDFMAEEPLPERWDRRPERDFLDVTLSGKNKDSLVYDVGAKMIYIYEKGDIDYGEGMNMQADFMQISMDTKEITAYGKGSPESQNQGAMAPVSNANRNRATTGEDEEEQLAVSTEPYTKPKFTEAGTSYEMDTVIYNMDTRKMKIKGVVTRDGEGYLTGQDVKMQPDRSFSIKGGKFTTCENVDHPHFYINMNKAKVIPGQKVLAGYSYFVFEDVPLYFLAVPEAMFPLNTERESGFIMPSYGEETMKGFFLRDGGYYFKFNDYVDLKLTAGIYTLGSWEAAAASKYTKRYRYNGNVSLRFSKDIVGDKGSADYINQNNFKISWTHTQDPKFKPNSTFSASVNYSTSGYSKYGSTTLSDYLNSQTNSSIAFSKSWPGTPFSLSANIQHSQNSRDTTISLSLPNIVFNMSRINPFKRKHAIGRERWYEKIALSYKATMANNVTTKQPDLFKRETLDLMRNGVQHTIPVSANFNLFNYINISPSLNYTERWYFKKINRMWDPDSNQIIVADTTRGFYRVYNYNASVSASTTIYGMYQMKNPDFPLQAVRHVINPSVGFSWAPNFGDPKYGYYKEVQRNAAGDMTTYSPFAGELYGVPGNGRQGSLTFSLSQQVDLKVRNRADTSGTKVLKLIDNLSVSGSYNFLADSMNLSTLNLSFRTSIIPNFGISLNAVLDPYEVDKNTGARINKLTWARGNLGRIASTSWSWGYTFKSSDFYEPVVNDINSQYPEYSNPFYFDPDQPIDPTLRRQLMSGMYYDFNLPWNLGFNFSISYTNTGVRKIITKTLGFQGSLNLTDKWGITFNGGYDFEANRITPGVITLARDLHCWQMNFTCVPVGARKSWSFNISANSSLLKDLKYEKSSSFYDNLYE